MGKSVIRKRRITMLKKSIFLLIILILLTGTTIYAKGKFTLNLSKYYNVDGISWETNKSDGDLDTSGNTYPANLFPKKGKIWDIKSSKYGSIPFSAIPIKNGKKNFVSFNNQKIKINGKKYDKLYILITSVNGDDFGGQEGTIELTYTDNKTEKNKIKISDWCMEPEHNEETAFTFAYRHTSNDGALSDITTKLWLITVDLNKKKKLKQIKLAGKNDNLFISAMSLSK